MLVRNKIRFLESAAHTIVHLISADRNLAQTKAVGSCASTLSHFCDNFFVELHICRPSWFPQFAISQPWSIDKCYPDLDNHFCDVFSIKVQTLTEVRDLRLHLKLGKKQIEIEN